MTPKTPPEKSSKPRMKHWTPTQNHNKQHTNIHAPKPPFYHFLGEAGCVDWFDSEPTGDHGASKKPYEKAPVGGIQN